MVNIDVFGRWDTLRRKPSAASWTAINFSFGNSSVDVRPTKIVRWDVTTRVPESATRKRSNSGTSLTSEASMNRWDDLVSLQQDTGVLNLGQAT